MSVLLVAFCCVFPDSRRIVVNIDSCFCVQVSETLVLRNGDFLVRDSLTSVGDYVLTCRWDNEVLHFKISKVLVKSSETKVLKIFPMMF